MKFLKHILFYFDFIVFQKRGMGMNQLSNATGSYMRLTRRRYAFPIMWHQKSLSISMPFSIITVDKLKKIKIRNKHGWEILISWNYKFVYSAFSCSGVIQILTSLVLFFKHNIITYNRGFVPGLYHFIIFFQVFARSSVKSKDTLLKRKNVFCEKINYNTRC